jgi:hypothetical protein
MRRQALPGAWVSKPARTFLEPDMVVDLLDVAEEWALPRAGFAVSSSYSTASSRIGASRSRIMFTLRGERPAASSSPRNVSTRCASSSAVVSCAR